MSGTPAGRTDGHSTPAGPEARGRPRGFSGVGLRPDRDHAAPGARAAELAGDLRAAAVDLDALDVVRRRVAREVGRRFPPVEKILWIASRRRPRHLRDAVVRDADLLHAAHRDEHVDQVGRAGALDLLFRNEVPYPGLAAPLEVREAP